MAVRDDELYSLKGTGIYFYRRIFAISNGSTCMIKIFFTIIIILFPGIGHSQRNWKQERNEGGINVFSSDVPNSVFKAIKVEAELTGTYTKLIALLSDVSQFSKWIYHSKTTTMLQKNSALDFIYHTETFLPWPMSNRDAVIHLQFNTDSLPKFMTITGTGEPGRIPKTAGLVRVSHYSARWKVTMPSVQTIRIYYELELDPGGSLPGWMANMFADKGPFETFSNLAKKLKE